MKYEPLRIGDLVAKVPLIQGGMGVGVSLSSLAGAVAKEGGIGIISTAQIGFKEPDYEKNPLDTYGGVGRQLLDTIVVGTNAQLIVGTQHTERFDATNLALLDFESLGFAHRVEHRANGCTEYLQACTHVGGTANDIERLARTDIDRRYVQVVRIGVIDAGQHLADNHTCQTATNGFDLLELFDFETYICQNFSDLLSREIGFQIIFQPIV